jgi:diaminopimelate epimerase
MDNIEFWKMNGSGNDFILIDNRDGQVREEEMGRLVERACRRRESVGADGVIFVAPSDQYDFNWRYFNADGGEVEMCGNGGRCVARFAYLKGIAGDKMTFGTKVGPISAEVDDRIVRVLMPNPTDLRIGIDLPLEAGWESVDFLNTGVPHVVIQVKDLDEHPVFDQGRAIRNDAIFSPEGTNANFIKISGPDQIDIRTYERGVEDETLACGTGSIAAVLIADVKGLVESPVIVRTRGGESLKIYFKRADNAFSEVYLEGNTSLVYKGQLEQAEF